MKEILISFIIFTCIIMVCRHIVADIKQEEHIIVLENAVKELQLRQIEYEENMSHGSSATEPVYTKPEQPRRSYQPRQSYRKDTFVKKEDKPKAQEERKFSNPIVLDLNTVDSATLVKVPGIAERSAAIILKYREQLGGFYTPYQLGERLTWDGAQERLDEWCNSWFMADERFIRKIDVNRVSFKELLRHPYLDYEQTKALVNYRDKHNGINSIKVLQMLEPFTDEDIERLQYYLRFE